MDIFISNCEEDTIRFAENFSKSLHGGLVVAFQGGLGMGKTAFVRGALRGLGNKARVSSPTFALVNDYGGDPQVYHFDMYRITSEEDLYSTGYFDYLTDDSILFIEWSENILPWLPENTVFVKIEKGDAENARIISTYTGEKI